MGELRFVPRDGGGCPLFFSFANSGNFVNSLVLQMLGQTEAILGEADPRSRLLDLNWMENAA
jgi:hypothetical protein